MPHNRTLWTLYESHKHGLTRDLLDAFRQRAAAEGHDAITVLVRLMRQYALPAEAAGRTDPPTADPGSPDGTVPGRSGR